MNRLIFVSLNKANRLSSSRSTQESVLTIDRKPAQEYCLSPVLTEKRQRRRASRAVVVMSLILAAGLVIPVALLHGAQPIVQVQNHKDENDGSSNQTKSSDDDQPAVKPAAAATPTPAAKLKPQDKKGQSLFDKWQTYARTDGKIPGALIGKLGDEVKYFISLNKEDSPQGHDLSVRFEKLLPRIDAARDWKPLDVVSLLDDVAAIHSIPLENALNAAAERVILSGDPLPRELIDASWGKPAPNGLRVAWHLEPRAKWYPIGTTLRSRILVHNSGDETVFFIMPSWQQSSAHTARDAQDAAIKVSSMFWTTRARKLTYRLRPGEYCETPAPGVGIGAGSKPEEDWKNVRPGAWIGAKQGDEVRFSPGAVEVRCSSSVVGTRMINGRPMNVDPKNADDLWETIIAERVERELPLPAEASERERIIRRVILDLFDETANAEEIAEFVADLTPDARVNMQKRLLQRSGVVPFTGTLLPGEERFRVHGQHPDAATRPRVATGPGYYNLGTNRRLQIERTRQGDRRVNKATLRFFSADRKIAPPPPHDIALPDGLSTYAVAWQRESTVLWVVQKNFTRSYDFTNPAKIKEQRFDRDADDKVPAPVRDAVKNAFDMLGTPIN